MRHPQYLLVACRFICKFTSDGRAGFNDTRTEAELSATMQAAGHKVSKPHKTERTCSLYSTTVSRSRPARPRVFFRNSVVLSALHDRTVILRKK